MKKFNLTLILLLCALIFIVKDARSDEKINGINEIIIVFENWYLEDIELEARFFFSKKQVIEVTKEIKDFCINNKEFCSWVEGVDKPGFHLYGEGYADQVGFISYLIGNKSGWICCVLQGSFIKTKEVKKPKYLKNKYHKYWWIDPFEKKRIFPYISKK